MISNTKKLLSAFQGKTPSSPPFWFMRQAGRYLPEYKQVRSSISNFLELCYTPSLASEVTLQPIRRFAMDGAIIFSDILVIPDALGIPVVFQEKVGPVLTPVQSVEALQGCEWNIQKLAPVYEALRLTKAQLPEETTLFGFVGSPWTLACYIVQGKSDQAFERVKNFATSNHDFFKILMEKLTSCVIDHCARQIEAGAEVIQLFDSWAGVLDNTGFDQWVIEPTQHIVASLKQSHPHVPIIGFPRLAGEARYLRYAERTGVDGISIDPLVSLEWAAGALQDLCLVQGNLDPVLLAGDQTLLLEHARNIISKLAAKRFIFNLGHGVLPHTPVENVQALCNYLHSL